MFEGDEGERPRRPTAEQDVSLPEFLSPRISSLAGSPTEWPRHRLHDDEAGMAVFVGPPVVLADVLLSGAWAVTRRRCRP